MSTPVEPLDLGKLREALRHENTIEGLAAAMGVETLLNGNISHYHWRKFALRLADELASANESIDSLRRELDATRRQRDNLNERGDTWMARYDALRADNERLRELLAEFANVVHVGQGVPTKDGEQMRQWVKTKAQRALKEKP